MAHQFKDVRGIEWLADSLGLFTRPQGSMGWMPYAAASPATVEILRLAERVRELEEWEARAKALADRVNLSAVGEIMQVIEHPCENSLPDCGPATHTSKDEVPLCERCARELANARIFDLEAEVERHKAGERERQIELLEEIDHSAVEADKDSVGYDCGASTRRILRAKLAELRKEGGGC